MGHGIVDPCDDASSSVSLQGNAPERDGTLVPWKAMSRLLGGRSKTVVCNRPLFNTCHAICYIELFFVMPAVHSMTLLYDDGPESVREGQLTGGCRKSRCFDWMSRSIVIFGISWHTVRKLSRELELDVGGRLMVSADFCQVPKNNRLRK